MPSPVSYSRAALRETSSRTYEKCGTHTQSFSAFSGALVVLRHRTQLCRYVDQGSDSRYLFTKNFPWSFTSHTIVPLIEHDVR